MRSPARVAQGSLPFALQWHRSIFGGDIGLRGLETVDLDGDGRREIVATAAATSYPWIEFWYVLTFRDGRYEHDWTSPPYVDYIGSLRVVNVDGDPAPEIVVGVGSRIEVYDGATRQLQQTVSTVAYAVRGLSVADVDSDGALEFVFCDNDAVYVYGAASGILEYAGPGFGGWDLAVGNVDNDPVMEIVVGSGLDPGYVLDGQTHAVEWTNAWGFGDYVRLGDVDQDGRQEVVSGNPWGDIRIFDVEQQSLAASIPVFDLDALRVLDVEADGPLEIVYGDGQWGAVHVFNGQTLQEKWSMPNPDHGVTDIAFGDTDGDGVRELLWGAGQTSSGPDHLYVANPATQTVEWQSLDFSGPFLALSYGDVDADGRNEILYGSYESDSGYGDGLYFVHDALTHELEYQSGPTTGLNWTGLWRIRNANVDGDPQQEIFVTTDETYTGIIICYDGLSHAEQWRAQVAAGENLVSMAVADVDGDGQLEIAAGVAANQGAFVYVFNATTGALEWRSPNLSAFSVQPSLLRVAELDGDGRQEIVVGAHTEGPYAGSIYVIDGVTHTIQNLGSQEVSALETADRDGNGIAELIVGTGGGALRVLDPFNGNVVQTIGTYPARIDGLAVADVTGDGVADYAFAMDNEVFVYDGASNTVAWSSGLIGGRVGWQDSLLIADVDGDSVLELVVSLGTEGLRVYDGGPLRLIVGDATAQETPAGGTATFTVALSSVPAAQVTVQYATANGTATAGVDYTPVSGTLVFPAGTTTRTVSVAVLDDAVYDPNETFFLNLSSPTGAAIQDGQGVATILDNEPSILMVVDDVAVVEGSAGTTNAVFTVRLSALSGQTITVNFATADGTATAPGDYQAATGTLTFNPGALTQDVTVAVVADTAVEADETFLLNLSGPVNATIADGQAVGTILDDDAVSLSRIEISHGTELVADLAAQPGPVADQDYYRLGQEPRSSYEVVVDAASGDVVPLSLDRLAADNATVVQAATPVGTGTSVSLRWLNAFSLPIVSQHIRVRSGGCSTDCGTDDTYRLRVYETTYAIPRFNNSGSQRTVLLVHNPTDHPVSGQVYFWHANGTLLHAEPLAVPAKGLLSMNTSAIAPLAGQSGSITVANDARYGDLSGKAVALEPGTGFSFDSMMVVQPK